MSKEKIKAVGVDKEIYDFIQLIADQFNISKSYAVAKIVEGYKHRLDNDDRVADLEAEKFALKTQSNAFEEEIKKLRKWQKLVKMVVEEF